MHYLPEKDVRLDLLRPTDHHTRCPYKGEASYWTIEVPAGDGSGAAIGKRGVGLSCTPMTKCRGSPATMPSTRRASMPVTLT